MQSVMNRELAKAGLPHVERVVGRTYVLSNEHGHCVAGTVTSVGYGPTEGISLRVSSPRLAGYTIEKVSWRPDEGGWMQVDADTGERLPVSLEFCRE